MQDTTVPKSVQEEPLHENDFLRMTPTAKTDEQDYTKLKSFCTELKPTGKKGGMEEDNHKWYKLQGANTQNVSINPIKK